MADNVVALAQELQQTAAVFEELIDLYRQRKDLQGYRTINDVKLLFDRIFVTNSNGSVYLIEKRSKVFVLFVLVYIICVKQV